MKASVYQKLEVLSERFEEVQALLSDPETISNQDKFRALSQEFKQLEQVTSVFSNYKEAEEDFSTAELMLKDDDPDMREMAQEEYKDAKKAVAELADELQILLLSYVLCLIYSPRLLPICPQSAFCLEQLFLSIKVPSFLIIVSPLSV